MFAKGKYFRTISLNTHYLWLLRSIRDNSTIKTLGTQMGQRKFLFDCYTDAMKTNYGHLFINLRPSADDNTRVRTKMFDSPSIVYVKKWLYYHVNFLAKFRQRNNNYLLAKFGKMGQSFFELWASAASHDLKKLCPILLNFARRFRGLQSAPKNRSIFYP